MASGAKSRTSSRKTKKVKSTDKSPRPASPPRIPWDQIPAHIQSLRERLYREVLPAALKTVLRGLQKRKGSRIPAGKVRRKPENTRAGRDFLPGPAPIRSSVGRAATWL